MRKRPQSIRTVKGRTSRRGKQLVERPRKPTAPPEALPQLSEDGGGFLSLLRKRIDWDSLNSLQQRSHAAGRPEHHLSRGQLLGSVLLAV